MTRRLLLVRHGLTAWNSEGRFQGRQDPPLSRARQTAEAVREALAEAGHHVELELDARLMEIGQGEWEGRTHAELAVQDAERYAAWRAHAGHDQPPGGEPVEQALARIAELLDELTDELTQDAADAGWPVCLVSHGGILRLAARHLLGLETRRAWAMDVDNASLGVLSDVAQAAWRLDSWNDASHLLGRAPLHVDESEGEPLAL